MSHVTSAALDRQHPLPLWAQLEADLRRRLAEGELAGQLPPEEHLAAEYAVSRQTVREAIRRLRDAGVLRRERGRGTFVVGHVLQPLGTLYSLFRNVEAQGMVQTSVVRTLERRRQPEVAVRLDLPDDAELVYLERLRLADGTPLALDRVWLPARLTAPLLVADFRRTALYDELWRRCGIRIDGGWERMRPVVPPPAERRLLELPPKDAALAVERLGRAGTVTVEWRTAVIRGDRYSVVVEWGPQAHYRVDVASA